MRQVSELKTREGAIHRVQWELLVVLHHMLCFVVAQYATAMADYKTNPISSIVVLSITNTLI